MSQNESKSSGSAGSAVSQSDVWKKMFGSESNTSHATDARASKRFAMSADDPSLKDLSTKVDMALRLASIATSKNREQEALTVSSLPLKKEGLLNSAMNVAHQDYLKRTKSNKGHGLGDGSTFRFGALLIALAEKVEGEQQQRLMTYIATYVPTSTQAKREIRMCKTEVMHSSETVRFKLSIPSDFQCECFVVDCVQKVESAVQWFGPRPAGFLEQEAQKLLGNK
tara:strand:- start:69 stop:743 length:675 start_codon:yes stop_codon:yes gene_type:complete